MALSVKLNVFEGPLDLLLHLIDKKKIDIYDIPIVEITDQYMEYLHSMEKEDLGIMSEFLVMAATLLDIKCKMLLPKEVNEEGEEEDPRAELVQKLLEYKMYKYMAYEMCIRDSSRDITREKLQEEFLEERAQKDPLTGVYNRFFGKELIDEYLASRNPYAGCGMMVLDVDYFKNVNDTYGHMFGDEVLKRFAELFVALFDINDCLLYTSRCV